MAHPTLRALALLALAAAATAAPSTRAELPLADWRFQPGHLGAEPAPADGVAVRLPYVWTQTWLRPKAAADTSWAKADLHELNSGWYETEVAVPAEWQGKRLVLDLRGVQCDAVVYVGAQRVAELKGPDGQVDLTAALTPGRTAPLRLWVTRWWEGTANQRSADLLRDVTIKHQAHSEWYHNEDEIRRAIPAGISEGVTLLALPAAGNLEQVAVATSTRRGELRATVETRLAAPLPGARIQVQVTELNGATAGLPTATVTLEGPTQTVVLPWADAHRWEVGAPYLYRLETRLLGPDGAVIDALPVRFGFRELWAEGRELMLNGHRLRLRPSYFNTTVPAMEFFAGMGFNAMFFQPNPTGWYGPWGLFPGDGHQGGTRELLDAADERGWAVLMPAPGGSILRDTLLKPEAQALYLRDLRTWLRGRDRLNRPSILLWSASMNTQGYPPPELVGRKPTSPQPAWFAAIEQMIRSVDPTRLIYHHAGGQTGDMETANLYLNWVPLAEQEEYLSAWSRAGEKPWAGVEHGSPLTVDFFKRSIVPYFTEYAAADFGDAAYAAERDEYVDASLKIQEKPGGPPFEGVGRFSKAGVLPKLEQWTAYGRVMDRRLRGVNRAWRAYGLNGGIFPWFFDVGFGAAPGMPPKGLGYLYETLTGTPEELHRRPAWANTLYDAYHDTMQPLLAYLGGPPARFTALEPRYASGEAAERSIVVVWDGPGERMLTAHWTLEVAGKPVQTGDEPFRLGPGTNEKRPVRFTVPAVTAPTAAQLRLDVRDATGQVATDAQGLTIYPPTQPAKLAARWGLYDPAGETAAEWATVGLKAKPINAAADLRDLDVLVVGRNALSRPGPLPFGAADVARGLRVLVLEQGVAELEALGFRVQDTVPRYVFPRVRERLNGVDAADLANWRGAGTLLPTSSAGMRVWPWPHGPHIGNTGSVASVVIETPHAGAFTPLLECEFDLAWSPLLSWRHGRGEVLFSQLDFSGRLGHEPAADRLARAILTDLDRPAPGVQDKRLLLRGDAEAVLGDLGFRRAPAGAALDPKTDVVVVGPGAGAYGAELAPFVAAGGRVLAVAQSAADLAAAKLPWPLPTQPAKATKVDPARLSDDTETLRGIGPQLVHWRTFLTGATFAEQGLPPRAQRLLDGWLLRVDAGAGRWTFSQLDPRTLDDGSDNLRRARWNAHKLYGQLLTNLGVATDDGLAEQLLAPRRYASMVPVGLWQVLQQAAPIAPEVKDSAVPGLAAPLPAERWVAQPDPAHRREFTWRLRTADANGYLDLTPVAPAKLGQVGYAVTHVYSSAARSANMAVSADYWLVLKVNGVAVADQAKEPRPHAAPRPGELRLRVPLRAGWNRLEFKVASGSGGFGFWCQMSDPGDLRVSPTVTAPGQAPTTAPTELLREPLVLATDPLYAEPLQKEDDPYGFTAW